MLNYPACNFSQQHKEINFNEPKSLVKKKFMSKYKVISLIGHGAFGQVFKCLNLKTNKLVAPVVKWVGGKRQLLPEIKKYSPKKFNTYFLLFK